MPSNQVMLSLMDGVRSTTVKLSRKKFNAYSHNNQTRLQRDQPDNVVALQKVIEHNHSVTDSESLFVTCIHHNLLQQIKPELYTSDKMNELQSCWEKELGKTKASL